MVACDLMVAAKLLATAHDPRLGKKKSAAARKLISIARELQAPRNLVAVARRLEKAGSQPLKKLGAKSRT